MDLDILHLGLCLVERLLELAVEIVEDGDIIDIAGIDAVKHILHLRGELDVDYARKFLLEQLCSRLAELGGHELLGLALDIVSLDYGCDYG